MNKTAKLLLAAAFAVSGLTAQAETLAKIDTNYGTIKLSLDEQRAPKTVANFVRYAEKGFYNNTVFHRVIDGFMAVALLPTWHKKVPIKPSATKRGTA